MAAVSDPPQEGVAPVPHERLRDRIIDRLFSDMDTIVRCLLSCGVLILLGLVIVVSFSKTSNWNEAKELLTLILPVVSLITGAIGAYFFKKEK